MAKAARNAGYTKEYNRKMFIRLLRREALSRAEIARRLGLTRAAATLIADELFEEGIIHETAASGITQLGRTPVPLALCSDAGYAAGVYLNRDGCTAGIVDMCGQVIAQKKLHIGQGVRNEKVKPLSDCIRDMIVSSGIDAQKMIGIGVSAPGPLDGESGKILNPPHFSLWHQTDIGPMLTEQLGLPVYLENNASCLAYYNVGKAETEGSANFLLLLVDSGIGSGVIVNDKVFKGAGYFTSELGHTSIHYRGKACDCGNRGCLEAYASIPNLLRDTPFSSWEQLIGNLDSDPEAKKLLRLEADYLAAGIINMTNLISIDTVLLAGDLLCGIEHLAPLLEKKVNSRILRRDILPIRVLPSCCGPDSHVQAAADVAFNRYLMV